MKNKELTLEELHNKIINKEISATELVTDSFEKIQKYDDKYNIFINIFKTEILSQAQQLKIDKTKQQPLLGIPISFKDTFAYKDHITTGGSSLLSDFIPNYDATVVKQAKEAGAMIIGKNTTDELGMAGTGTFCYTGDVKNPWNEKHITSGSSSGSSVAVALDIVKLSICSDTGDSIRRPASYLGIAGFKPSYSLISRNGMFPYSPSLDTVGMVCRNVDDLIYSFKIFNKHDPKDMTSQAWNFDYDAIKVDKQSFIKKTKLVVLKDLTNSTSKEVQAIFEAQIAKIRAQGIIVEEIDFGIDLLKTLLPIYRVISYAESTSCSSNLTGWYFGQSQKDLSWKELGMKNRDHYFGSMLKDRFTLGTYFLQKKNQGKILKKAKIIRRIIVERFNDIMKKYDAIIAPSTPTTAPTFESIEKYIPKVSEIDNVSENYLLIANFVGAPSLTIPMGFVNEMPVGINITSVSFKDDLCLRIGYFLEEIIGLKNLNPGDKNV